jgi:transposase
MNTPRVKCLKCHKQTWHQPTFVNGQKRITQLFEEFIEKWLSRLTIQDITEVFGISWNTIRDIDILRLKKLTRPGLKGLTHLAIDEKHLGQQYGFVTIVIDLHTRAIVAVLKGRGKAALAPFFLKLKAAGAKVQAVATDMAGGYIAAVQELLPKATLVFDHFHIIKLMNDKLTSLRRDMYHELKDKLHRDVIKGTRWLLVKNPENLKITDKVDEVTKLNAALKLNESLAKAYYLKDELRQFWCQKSKAQAEKFLEAWCRRASATGIKQLQTMSKTLRQHRQGLLNWYEEQISTGPLEGINNKIEALKRRAYGYRNYDHLQERLLTLHHAKFRLTG